MGADVDDEGMNATNSDEIRALRLAVERQNELLERRSGCSPLRVILLLFAIVFIPLALLFACAGFVSYMDTAKATGQWPYNQGQ